MTLGALTTFALVAVLLPIQLPQPQIQNGRVETRQVTSLDREVTALAGPEPVWALWRVPMIDGERGTCSWYNDGNVTVRGYFLDMNLPGTPSSGARPQIAPPTGPVALEAGTGLLVLVRLVDGRIERLRSISDDCPMDANGRTVYLLTGVTSAESLRYLDTFTRVDGPDRMTIDARRNMASSALQAIRLHRDAAADVILERIATSDRDTDLRRQTASSLAAYRGPRGFATVKKLVETERDPELRRSFVSSLGQTRDAGTVDALRTLLRDQDPRIRAEAVYWFAQRGGTAVVSEVTKIIDGDIDNNVKQRAVSGLARLPKDEGVPQLIQIARTSKDPVVRKQAVSALGQSKDARAVAFLEEILKR